MYIGKSKILRHKLLNIVFQVSLDNFSSLYIISVNRGYLKYSGKDFIDFFSMAKELKFISFKYLLIL